MNNLYKFQLFMGVLCLALGPALAQITFSRSWVPQGKRSGTIMASSGTELGTDGCQDAKLALLAQVAGHIAELIDEISETSAQDESVLAMRLKHALVTRQRKLS